MLSMFETDAGIHWCVNDTLNTPLVISKLSNVERSSELTLKCCLTIVSCTKHMRQYATKTDYPEFLVNSVNVSARCGAPVIILKYLACHTQNLNLYAWWMTIVVNWDRSYLEKFMH